MCQHVSFQIAPLVERPRAVGALVDRLIPVRASVHGQRAALTESLTALGTLEGLDLTVDVSKNKEKTGE